MTRRRTATIVMVLATGIVAGGLAVALTRSTDPQPLGSQAGPSDGVTDAPSPGSVGQDPVTVEQSVDVGPGIVELSRCLSDPPTAERTRLPTETSAAIEVISEQVAADRGLTPDAPILPVLLSDETLRERVTTLTERDYPPETAAVDQRLLVSLGAIPADTDLLALFIDLLGEQIAGFYDPDTGELVTRSDGSLDAATAIILAHEIDHALTDAEVGLPDLDAIEGDTDASLATQALVEGGATLLMQRWTVQQLNLVQQLAAAIGPTQDQDVFENAPPYIQEQLTFPYLAGLSLACAEFVDGGWASFDRALANPPTTTAQVLWPERYRAGEAAIDVADPSLPAGWDSLRRDTFGAADLLWLFQAPGGQRELALSDPLGRAGAWGGGELVLGDRDGESLMAITLVSHPDATTSSMGLCDSMTEWVERTLEEVAHALAVRCDGEFVHIGVGPDQQTAASALP